MEPACFGGKNADTKEWSDLPLLGQDKTHKVSAIFVWTDGKVVGGLQFHYTLANGTKIEGEKHVGSSATGFSINTLNLNPDEYITQIEGRSSKVLDYVSFKTNKGNTIVGGGKAQGDCAFSIEIPPGYHAAGFFGGSNGHIHYISAQILKIKTGPLSSVSRSVMLGRIHDDTKGFDEFKPELVHGKIRKVKLYHDGYFLYGFETTFEIDEKVFRSGIHISHKALIKGGLKKEVLRLEKDEHIIEVSGRNGDVFDRIKLVTNKGNVLEVGGTKGSPFPNLVAPGKKVVAFAGGYGKHLHNLFLYVNGI